MRKFKHDEHLFRKVRAFIAETNEVNASEAVTSGFDINDFKGNNAAATQLYEGFDFGGVKAANDAATQLYEGFDFGG
eukprot:6365069-Amphidinium_carterae.1